MEMEMRERRWEELDMNCLARIFARLGLEDKVVSLPFVCKSWSRASLDPLCWRSLNFDSLSRWPLIESFATRFQSQYPESWLSFSGLLKLALHRSQGSTTELFLPWPVYDMYEDDDEDVYAAANIFQEDLELVEKECHGIKIFSFATMDLELEERIPKMVANWENLETLGVSGNVDCFEETLAAIKEHCARFGCLTIAKMYFGEVQTKAVVTLLPRLKRLSLLRVTTDKECLMSLLNGCKELVELRIESCRGFLPDDDVMKRAAAIRTFVYVSPTNDEEDLYFLTSPRISDVYGWNFDDGYEL